MHCERVTVNIIKFIFIIRSTVSEGRQRNLSVKNVVQIDDPVSTKKRCKGMIKMFEKYVSFKYLKKIWYFRSAYIFFFCFQNSTFARIQPFLCHASLSLARKTALFYITSLTLWKLSPRVTLGNLSHERETLHLFRS